LQKTRFWTFWRFSGWISAKLALIWSKMHLQHDSLPFLTLTLRFSYDILSRACAEIKISDGLFPVQGLHYKINQGRGQRGLRLDPLRPAGEAGAHYLIFLPFANLLGLACSGIHELLGII